MSGVVGGPKPVSSLQSSGMSQQDKLKKASHDLEGLFVNELFKAMRATLPTDGILDQAPGQDMFQGMMDQKIADLYSGQQKHGLGEALYRQLSHKLSKSGQS